MKIGFVGLGKLGLACAVAMAAKGHDVLGYDIEPRLMSRTPRPYRETGADGVSPFDDCLAASTLRFAPLSAVVAHAELLFVAVQTPHDPEFEGVTPLPARRADFDYRYLRRAVDDIARVISPKTILVVVSTVMPGTMRAEVVPRLPAGVRLAYNPYFISMGTAMRDFLHPEFTLCGTDEPSAAAALDAFYRTISPAPFYGTSIENAELIKVSYNTYISMKIGFANTIMEMCHHLPGADVDGVTDALTLATDRLMSGKYLRGGMGDGGGCHPRDNIAMSWFAAKIGASVDWCGHLMHARERQTAWLADLMEEHPLPKAILGYSFKAESNIRQGSPALLLKHILEQRGHAVFLHDPLVEGRRVDLTSLRPMVFLIGANHQALKTYRFPAGSVVIDPWRYLPARQSDVQWISIGRGPAVPRLVRQ